METYLVGGAIRDQLLGLSVSEKDWVVVGSTPEEMLRQGFQAVGKDFPVFLHPKTHEEYALARTERKTAPGYTGFSVYAAVDVTLEQDLQRRDLTINAIAQQANGDLIDPYHGQADLAQRVLRHISPAFSEDPVRVLRVARFAAKLEHLGFIVAPETLDLMQAMTDNGEINALTPERVWKEWEKSLTTPRPSAFLRMLQQCGALALLAPALNKQLQNQNVSQQLLQSIDVAARNQHLANVCFAVSLHRLDTDESNDQITNLCQQYHIPKLFQQLAFLVATHHDKLPALASNDATAALTLIECLDGFRRPQRLKLFIDAVRCIYYQDDLQPQIIRLQQAHQVATKVDAKALLAQGLQGAEIATALNERRLQAISELFQQGS